MIIVSPLIAAVLGMAHWAPVPWKHWLPWLWESGSQPRPAHRPFPGCRIPSDSPSARITDQQPLAHTILICSLCSALFPKYFYFNFSPYPFWIFKLCILQLITYLHENISSPYMKMRKNRHCTDVCVCTPSWVETMCQGRNLAEPRDMLR